MRRETEIELSKSLVVAYAYLAETRSPVHAKLASYVDLIWASREIEMDKREKERRKYDRLFRPIRTLTNV